MRVQCILMQILFAVVFPSHICAFCFFDIFGLVRGSSPGQFGYFRVILPPHTARTLVLVPAEAVVRGLFNLPTDSQPLFSPRGISRPNCGSRPTPGPASYLRAPSSEVKVFNLFLYAQYLLYVCNLFIYMHMHVCQII